MALDTQDKRLSAIHLGSPWRGMLPLPDGTLSQADRQHVMFLYRGILAGAAAVTGTLVGVWSNVIQCHSANQRIECFSANKRLET